MAHIPKEDIRQLWKWTPQQNWSALEKTLEQHRDKADGISDTLIVAMRKLVKEMENAGQQYPSSVDQLYEMLNERLHAQPQVQREASKVD